MKIIFASGGSGGPNAPLIAIYEELKKRDVNLEALWLGTKKGVEKKMIEPYQLPFKAIICGKLRRYFSLWNIFTPFLVMIGFIQSFFIMLKFKPDVVLTAGSFVAVPVIYAAWILKIPRFIHQQDLEIGLANKLIAKKASVITVAFLDQTSLFKHPNIHFVSNPVRQEIFSGSKENALKIFQLNPALKTILILGGGQGALGINQMVLETIGKLVAQYQIIHICGVGKKIENQLADYYDRKTLKIIGERYRSFEFLNKEIFDAYALADLVVCRAGLSTLTELAVLAKPALLIPLPGHQELNAQYFAKYNAAKILEEENLISENFIYSILRLLENPADLQNFSRNISQMIDKNAAQRYVDLIYKIIKG